MKYLKRKRNLWIIVGLGILLSMTLFIYDGAAFDSRYIFLSLGSIASFINAYKAHKKLS